jgi:AbrB family looped-hinge helix DNA binding protein
MIDLCFWPTPNAKKITNLPRGGGHRFHPTDRLPRATGKSQCILVDMPARLILDKLGRIVLPKPVRDKLQLATVDQLELESVDDRIMLRPLRGTAQLRKKHGVWIFHCGEPLSATTVQQTVEQVRRERDNQNLGRSR